MKKTQRGFTLIEILVVIGIIAILATVVLIAINPARQFQQANNSQRTSNVNTILNAIGQNIADNKGVFTCGSALPTASRIIVVEADSGNVDANTEYNLNCLVPTYLPSVPFDPIGTASTTGYTIIENGGRVTVSAPSAGLGTSISVTR